MITGRQLRAARGLLGWDATDLAAKAGLTRETVSKIENDSVQARESTLADISRVFDQHGLEFIDNQGVRLKPEGLEVLNGTKGMRVFFNNVYSYVQTFGGIIRQNGIEDDVFFKNSEDVSQDHYNKMIALTKTRKDVVVRVLMKKGALDFKCPEYARYRWYSEHAPQAVPYYIFGDTIGIFAIDEDSIPKIYQITSHLIATTYTNQFDSIWDSAANPLKADV